MPISTVLSLIPETNVTLRPTMGHHAHAAFLSIMKETNSELAEELHAQSAQKPFTVSPLMAKGTPRGKNQLHIRAGTECKLRFTFLDDELFAHFGVAFLKFTIPPIQLGNATFQVKKWVAHTSAAEKWGGNATYAQLIQTATDDTHIRLRFYSPTAFRTLTPRGQKTYNHTQIDLVRCYQSWINKWNAFSPVKLEKTEFLAFIAEYARLAQAETKTRALNFGRHTEVGWVGHCACRLVSDNAQHLRHILVANCLADFAFYCGTGYKTTMGMGQTKRLRNPN
ncbi:CRISPR-associated endoribonuclease Cas6 [Candidatus Poribacteria bacterium]|nr:MAG: CRISPR-associated endoribonuclease Cas6 [Candidatus Poribacteria bacterium]